MTSDKREKAIKYLTEEIRSLRMAPKINGCGPENWADQLEVMETCLQAVKACPPTHIDREAWINVENRLPEDEKPVLAYYGFYREEDDLGARFIGTLTYFSHDPDPHWQHESTGLFVTHWRPLPEPPAELEKRLRG